MRQYRGNNNSVKVRLRNGKSQVSRSVAKLVLLTFVGKPPKNAKQAKHLDGDPTNNRLDNLEWDVDKTYGLPPSPRARKLFNEEVERMIDIFISKNFYNKISFGEADIQDFKQECLISIWNVVDLLDNYDNLYYFCNKKCRWVFNRFYKKYKGRHQYVYFSQFANKEDGNCFADNMAEPSYKEYYDT